MALIICIFEFVLYFSSTVIGNQIKYQGIRENKIERTFYIPSRAFTYRYFLQIHHSFLLKDHLSRTQQVKAWDVTVRSIMVYEIVQVSLLLLTRDSISENPGNQGCDKDYNLTSQTKYTLTQKHGISNRYETLRKLQ